MRDRYLGVDEPGRPAEGVTPPQGDAPAPAPDEAALEREAVLAACRRVLVGGPIPHSLHAAYEEIARLVQSGQHREAPTP